MPRVLIPSDNLDFVAQLAAAHRRIGWDAAVGTGNFDLRAAGYDLIHFQWPEELCGWNPPAPGRLAELEEGLRHWSEIGNARLILTVHNLQPHRRGDDPAYRRLFEMFFAHVHVLAHFTETSRKLLNESFAVPENVAQPVTGYFNFDALRPPAPHRDAARNSLGLDPMDRAFLVLGGLRSWAEIALIRNAFAATNVPGKRLLMCGRYHEGGSSWRQRWQRWDWARWLRRQRAVVVDQFIPDAELPRYLEAADVLLIPRLQALNSGLPALGASFGKPIVAPRCGAFPELLGATENPLYEPGNALSFAAAIERAARLDPAAIFAGNRLLADGWSWDRIVERGLAAAGLG